MKATTPLIVIVSILLLVGCAEREKLPTKATPFIGGTTGVLIDFMEDSPPPEALDGGDFPFDVVVKLKNDGEYTVPKEDVEVRISGIRAEEFDLSESDLVKNPEEDLIAMEKDAEGNIRESTPVYVEFNGFNHVEELAGNTEFTFRADVCYVYQTKATAQICVRKDNLETEEGVCEVNEEKTVYNSGAPVQVVSFRETPRAKNKVAFTFEIQHKGNGNIYKKETRCDSARTNEDKVYVKVETNINGNLECSGLREGDATEGFATLYGGKKIITCTQEVNTESDYETPVDITITYDYKDNTETTVLVKHSPE